MNLTPEQRRELAECAKAATPGPWGEDDCNIFCRPMSNARKDAILAKLDGKPYNEEHLHLDAFVASTQQRHEQSDADALFIAAANPAVVLALLEERDRLAAALRAAVDTLDDALGALQGEGIVDDSRWYEAVAVAAKARTALAEEPKP